MFSIEDLIPKLEAMPIPNPTCRTCRRQLPKECFGKSHNGSRYVSCLDCRYEPECTICGHTITLTKRDGLRDDGSVIAPFHRGFRYQCKRCVPLAARPIWDVAIQYPAEVRRIVRSRECGLDPEAEEEMERSADRIAYRAQELKKREDALRERELDLAARLREVEPGSKDRAKGARWRDSSRKRIEDYGTLAECELILPSEVIEKQGSESCAICGAADDLVLDHVHPLAAGGPHTLDNVRLLCAPCNGWKVAEVDRPLIEARRGELRRAQLAAA